MKDSFCNECNAQGCIKCSNNMFISDGKCTNCSMIEGCRPDKCSSSLGCNECLPGYY